MEDKIVMGGQYAVRGEVDEQGCLKPGCELVRVLSVTLRAPTSVVYELNGRIYRVHENGLYDLNVESARDLVPVRDPEYVVWDHVDDVPMGAAFSRRDAAQSPTGRMRSMATTVGAHVWLGSVLCSYKALFDIYEWTTDGKTWHRCWKPAAPAKPDADTDWD